jgi:hypothetical protein
MTTRRDVLRLIPLAGCMAAASFAAEGLAEANTPPAANASMTLSPEPKGTFAPLDRLRIESTASGRLVARDGDGQVYCEQPIDIREHNHAEITIGGALGTHSISLLSPDGRVLDFRTFAVDCSTFIEDEGGTFGGLLKNLYWTMASDGPVGAMRYKGEVFTYWDSWLLDNTSTLKGMKYFWPEVKSNIDFYARSQREDGMIWENFEPRTPPETDWDRRFKYADFARPAEDGFLELRRAPVENHVEAFFFEAIYFAWKASGDTEWMAGKLDAAMRAVHYSTTDPYRWSAKYKLLKRGFTIDTWDFLCDSEAELVDGDIMKVDLEKTHFGVFYGDNTNFIAGLRRLAEMLEVAERAVEAPRFRAMADEMEARLNQLAWNGEFFTHWVPEDRSLKFNMGVDLDRQVSLSNAYSLNRGIPHEQCVAILKTYRRIRAEMPASSPGEFYSIYPPFESGFNQENSKWEYVNGGVMSCTAGELAHGAFENGFEEYGADILRRQKAIADRYRGFIPGILRGKALEAPRRSFRSLDMRTIANADFGAGTAGVPGWTSEPGNDLAAMPSGKQVFREVPFDVIDPLQNGHRACLGISSAPGYKTREVLPVNTVAESFYLLHTKGGDDLAGKLTVRYDDGSSHFEYIRAGINVDHWWNPTDSEYEIRNAPGRPERMQVAWRGRNEKFGNVGVYVTGFTNPHPAKTIQALEFESMDTSAKWMILDVTLCDAPVFLPPWNDVSYGMPNNWGAAALVFALLEGLGGVKDTGAAFDKARIAPRWSAADVSQASVSVRYPASRGYIRYDYRYDEASQRITMDFTGSSEDFSLAVLLPQGVGVRRVLLDGRQVEAESRRIEGSQYAVVGANRGAHTLELKLSQSVKAR